MSATTLFANQNMRSSSIRKNALTVKPILITIFYCGLIQESSVFVFSYNVHQNVPVFTFINSLDIHTFFIHQVQKLINRS
jgi:hypothetical protein